MAVHEYVIAFATGWALLVVQVAILVAAGNRLGMLPSWEVTDARTWHGRAQGQRDRDPQGVRPGFLLFMLTLLVSLFVSVTVMGWIVDVL